MESGVFYPYVMSENTLVIFYESASGELRSWVFRARISNKRRKSEEQLGFIIQSIIDNYNDVGVKNGANRISKYSI